MEGRKGEKSRAVMLYDVKQRRLIDAEITRRSNSFMAPVAASSIPVTISSFLVMLSPTGSVFLKWSTYFQSAIRPFRGEE